MQVLEVTKNASITDNGDGVNGVEDIITYTIKAKNAGNVNLSGLVVEDILSDAASNTMSLNVSPHTLQHISYSRKILILTSFG